MVGEQVSCPMKINCLISMRCINHLEHPTRVVAEYHNMEVKKGNPRLDKARLAANDISPSRSVFGQNLGGQSKCFVSFEWIQF